MTINQKLKTAELILSGLSLASTLLLTVVQQKGTKEEIKDQVEEYINSQKKEES